MEINHFPILLIFCTIITAISAANDTIDTFRTIRDGETLVSSGGIFEFGFFNPGNGFRNRYVGIWYKNTAVRTYVWVANRQSPLTTKSGVLRVTNPGILALFNDTSTIVWSSDHASTSVANPVARILDSGNLVVQDANRESLIIWQSFDHPTDTYLPGMMSIGWNLITGVETYLTSWKSNDDPAPGDYTFHLDPTGYPQLRMKLNGSTMVCRIGPWNGVRFSGTPTRTTVVQTVLKNQYEVRFGEIVVDRTILSRIRVTPDGFGSRQTLNHQTKAWTISRNSPFDRCDDYNFCGSHGVCDAGTSPSCGCLDRFVPKDPRGWDGADWSSGCVRRTQLSCGGDVFLTYAGIKLPDVLNTSVDEGKTRLEECEMECSKNCSCVAYTQLNISGGGSGCLFYHGELIDIRFLSSGGQDLYIRMASAEKEKVANSKGKNRVIVIVSITSVVGILLLCLGLILICFRMRMRMRKRKGHRQGEESDLVGPRHGEESDLPFFSLSTILKATDHFSTTNKLGEGGFGPVYKGKLDDGREIAAKRLSETSSQGADELRNEVILIAKLQHRNLVRLLGSCIQGEEYMLIYEYMPNSSLNLILFNQARSVLLDWGKRFHIINGIAKGLLYLHHDSRLRIIHRDLKASNILLDAEMNPKISDFGIAKSFGGNEMEARTCRVVGTHGYMSPEYMMTGLFSTKSDVFSFGVLVIEVVSGKRNRDFSLKDQNLNLIGHAWRLYKEESLLELVDSSLGDLFDEAQATRSIHVGLLCVQKCADDRPSMSSVVFMLGNEVELPQVKEPAFLTQGDVSAAESTSSGKVVTNSVNQVTITLVDGR